MELEQLLSQIIQAEESGEVVDQQQWLRRYPQHADDLSDFFQLHSQLSSSQLGNSQLNNSLQGRDSSHSSTGQPAGTVQQPAVAQPTVGPGSLVTGSFPASQTSISGLVDNPPQFLGDYEILEEIDRGGMGVVYKARHCNLSRVVALKLIRSGELASEEEVERFRSEAEAAAALAHPGIVPIYEVGMLQGLVYYTMAYIEGESLEQLAQHGPIDPQDAARIVHKLCLAIEHAHRNGVYHRDLKPANVLIDQAGQPIIIDFGLAKVAHRDHQLTATGQLLGTPAYMPPEHAAGRGLESNEAFDVYSLGAILYFLCAGQPPFTGPTPFDVLLQVLDRIPPKPSKLNRRVSHDLDYICTKALEKHPKARYQRAGELASDLQAVLRGEVLDCPPATLWVSLESWWRREPILVSHVCGIGATALIVAVSFALRGEPTTQFPARMVLLLMWLMACYALQYWVYRARWRDVACLTWATVDVLIYTTLIAFADPPRSMLLIGYPMLIVASSLFYRRRFVIYMTSVCAVGFLMLGWLVPRDDFVKPDFSAIFLMGLAVIGLTLMSTIRRIRGLSLYCE